MMELILNTQQLCSWGTQRRGWLSHCATSRKVAGSIPDGVTGIFHGHNPPSHTMALGLTQPLSNQGVKAASV